MEEKTDYKGELDETREKVTNFLKKKTDWLVYLGLAIVLGFGAFIRTRNIHLLKDITTGQYTLPDLDPYLFLRYAKEILENGSLPAIDMMRYVPLGKYTAGIEQILPYTIVYLYKFIKLFIPSVTIEFVDILYPVIFFVLGGIMFFLLVRRLFNNKVALLATAFLTVIPSYLYRTMAGVADKEPLGMFFMFTAMYFYIVAWQSNKVKTAVIMGALSGIATGLMGLSWGGVQFVLIAFTIFNLTLLVIGKFDKKDSYIYVGWIVSSTLILIFLTTKYGGLIGLMRFFSSALAFFVLIVVLIDLLIFKLDIIKIKNKIENKIPLSAVSILISVVITFIISIIVFTPTFITNQITTIANRLIHPLGINRWLLTVAENHQPYFVDWIGNFGRFYTYLFIISSIFLFYSMVKILKKHKLKITALYILFIFSFIWSRYSSNSTWNGESTISKIFYIGSLIGFILILSILYLYTFYKNKDLLEQIKSLDKEYIFLLIWFLLMIVAARGAIRLFFVFAPVTVIIVSYLFVELMKYSLNIKNKAIKITSFLFILLVLFSPFGSSYDGLIPDFAKNSYNQARFTGLSYNQQWQRAMAWVRENTPKDAVFAHWWDYGYWVQTGGERATVLDGGNQKIYWDYLMGRHVLTGQNETEALEFLKIHKATHFLIDPSDMGKYPAYSSIGSDENWDRYSWIGTYVLDQSQTRESRNQTLLLYTGGASLDDDFTYNDQVFKAQAAGIGGFIVPVTANGDQQTVNQPTAVLISNGKQTNVPLECVFINNQIIKFNEPGLKGCLRFIPDINNDGQGNLVGAALYISEKGTRAMWVRLYLLNEQFEHFKEVYSDQDQMPLALYTGRLIGPMRIWELSYPDYIKERPDYITGQLPDWWY